MENRNICFVRKQLFAVLLLAALLPLHGRAEVPSASEWTKVGAISTASLAISLGAKFVPTPSCFWCTPSSFDENIARAWQGNNLRAARLTSDIFTFGFVPMFALTGISLFAPTLDTFWQDSLVVITSALTTSAITEVTKVAVRRQRPEAYFDLARPSDQNNRSFLSGHTSFAFSILTATSVMALKHNSRYAPMFAGISFMVGTAVGLSRIIAAKHWTTDVLAGMALGIGVGSLMPFLILDPKPKDLSLAPDPLNHGLMLGMRW